MKRASLSDAIRGIRKSRGETMTEFARVLGIDQGTISKYESGKVVPRRSVLLLILPLTADGSAEREAILDALGLDSEDVEGLSPGEVQEGLEKFDEFLRQGGLKARRPRGDTRAEFADLAKDLLQQRESPDPAVNEILRAWIEHGSGKTSQIFKNAALYIDIELKALAAKKKK